ncbi:MAG: hypothetical protein PVF45_13170, partial [Anaerolineae bacterium]
MIIVVKGDDDSSKLGKIRVIRTFVKFVIEERPAAKGVIRQGATHAAPYPVLRGNQGSKASISALAWSSA